MTLGVDLQIDEITSENGVDRRAPEELLELEAPASPGSAEVDEHSFLLPLRLGQRGVP